MATRAAIPDALWVHGPDGLVGTLQNTDPLAFSHGDAWLARAGAEPIHPNLPLAPGPTHLPYVAAFFENLLPEGDQRSVISMREQVSTVFGLLARVGGESAGAFTLVPEGEVPQEPVYQPLTWEQVRGWCMTTVPGPRSAKRSSGPRKTCPGRACRCPAPSSRCCSTWTRRASRRGRWAMPRPRIL